MLFVLACGGVFLLLQAGRIAFRFSRAGSPFWRGASFLAPLGIGVLALALGIGTAPLAPSDASARSIAAISLLVLLTGMLTFAAVLLAPAPAPAQLAQIEPATPATADESGLSPTLLAQLAEITAAAADAPAAPPEPVRDREPAAV